LKLHNTSPGGVPPTIGRYRVVDRIGHGAMGDVYAAIDENLGRRVAIRVMRPDQKAEVTAQVTHPNVVTVFDRGEDQGRPYVVMELLEGAPLAEYLRRPETQTLNAKIGLMLQICDGLQAAHDRGVVHGHVKPGHVLVQQNGGVKLLDLGLPWSRGAAPYAPPEQVNGARADHRSDIFSAAAVFHFIVTGRPPLAPGVAGAEVPDALARVLARALDERPDRRHQNVAHLRAEIDQVRLAQQGDRYRVVRAALDRYKQIEELIDQRRALGRRLGLDAVERECGQRSAQLASAFPEFARAGNDSGIIVMMDPARATAALALLQTWHNEVLAEVAVLRAANGGRR
jgi:serine/threonine protein kinase